jgi:predicted Rossmann fold flavoprotein
MSGQFDAIILGGGAAGLFCAGEAARRGRRVLVIEGADTPGKKILISGGGRCNFTNIHAAPGNYISGNPHFAVSALSRFGPQDFIERVEARGIAWHEKVLGQLFCDGSARQILDMLLDALAGNGGELICGEPVMAVSHATGRFRVATAQRTVEAPQLVIATGGPSIPKLGASDIGYRLARQFGLKVVEPRPALVPLTLPGEEALFRELAGVAAPVLASAGAAGFAEAALFTHRGLSGPAILQVSSYWRHGEPIAIDFAPGAEPGWLIEAKRASPRAGLAAVLGERLPARLAGALCERLGVEGRLADQPDARLRAAEARLRHWRFLPNGTEGFAKAEVTVGGISTAELSSKTMEAKRVPGLYAIGEVVDVTGWLGGYNFQWAWASAWAAAQSL